MDYTKNTYIGMYLGEKMRNLRTGYTIFKVRVDTEIIICAGKIIPPANQSKVEVSGKWVNSDAYGRQLSDCSVREIVSGSDALTRYLRDIPGIGDVTAAQVSKVITGNLLSITTTHDDPVEFLAKEAKIQRSKAEAIIAYITTNQVHYKLFELINRLGGDFCCAERIYKKYAERSLEILYANPYTVGFEAGLNFKVCDKIASRCGITGIDKRRVLAAVETVLEQNAHAGNTYMPLDKAMKRTRQLLDTSEIKNVISPLLTSSIATGDYDTLILDGDRLYLRYMYWQEVRTAYAIRRLIKNRIPADCDTEELCAYAESVCGVKYAEQQREIFQAIKDGGVYVLTGGPGTGKTTVVKGFLTAYEYLHPENKVKLCAPTGRASQRMKEATGREATTIHRLLEYKPYGDTAICKNEADPIDADCIIVDESSMISIDVAELLFSAIRSGASVLLVGDVEQLPSVGPGNVLSDIISSGMVPVVALTKTQRQGEGSPIIENAHRIREGNPELMPHPDFKIIQADDVSIPGIITELYPQFHDPDDPFKVQVLSPSRKRPITGCTAISKEIQKVANRRSTSVRFGEYVFTIGDKVMTTQNNYSVGYFNGDIGTITHIGKEHITIKMESGFVEVPNVYLDDVVLAYASTVHKSQGSEYQTVIIALPSEPVSMLQRNILYTAVTRAKKQVILIASETSIMSCICTEKTGKRMTALTERLQGGTK